MIIGITGKSGSGKSAIAQKLAKKLDAYCLDLDTCFHETIELDIDHAVTLFGPEILGLDGKPNRKKIGDLVFANRDLYKEYSKHIYGIVLENVNRDLKEFGEGTCILDHILLPHMPELWEQCDLKILVEADWEIRRLRILARDNISTEYLMKREAASIEYCRSDFDMTIKNDKIVTSEEPQIKFEVTF